MNFKELYNQTNSKLFLIGETHGTKEMPIAFISILKEALILKEHINLFLEFPNDMQKLLNDYIHNKVDYKEFLKTKFFNPPQNNYDGRLSKNMFEIIKFAKENKNKISTYFVVSGNTSSRDEYERKMSENIFKLYDENKLNFYYVGEMHAITKEETQETINIFKNFNYSPCGIHLKNKISNATSILFKAYSGKYLTLYGTLDNLKVGYVKIKNDIKAKLIYNEFIKLENEDYDYIYRIKRVSPAYKLK